MASLPVARGQDPIDCSWAKWQDWEVGDSFSGTMEPQDGRHREGLVFFFKAKKHTRCAPDPVISGGIYPICT